MGFNVKEFWSEGGQVENTRQRGWYCRGDAWELGIGGIWEARSMSLKTAGVVCKTAKIWRHEKQELFKIWGYSINQQWNGEEPTFTSTLTKKQSGMFYFFSLFNVNVITTSQSYRYGTNQHQQVCFQWKRFDCFSQTHRAKSSETENSIRNRKFDNHMFKIDQK